MSDSIAKNNVAVGIGSSQDDLRAVARPTEFVERVLPRVGIRIRQDGASGLHEGNYMAYEIVADNINVHDTTIMLDVEEIGDMLAVDIDDMEIRFDAVNAGQMMKDGKTYYVQSIWMATDNDDVPEAAATVNVALEESEHYEIMEQDEFEDFGPSISMTMLDNDVVAEPETATVGMDAAEVLMNSGERGKCFATVKGVGSLIVGFKFVLKSGSGSRERVYKRTRKLAAGIPNRITSWATRSKSRSLIVEIVPADELKAFIGDAHYNRMVRYGEEFGFSVGNYEIDGNAKTEMRLK